MTGRNQVRSDFKSADWRDGLTVVERDVVAKRIDWDWGMVVDGDVDLVGIRTCAVVGPHRVGDGRRLKEVRCSRNGTRGRVEGQT